ncbi:MAG: serine/threonine protein kinase, partial [Myxococcales bacterium]|nr:serine/threonine protein kinase [Myxococcales bacterium]
ELLEGMDLGSVIRQSGPLAIRRAVHIARQICKALAAAHDAGIIHRDLKSENVVLTVRGGDPDFVKVLDFGICKQVDAASSSQTTPGMVMGSPDYMAPEQAAGAAANIKSDIYALGTILFEMLAGRLPFTGRNAIDVLMKKGAGPAPEVTELRPDVPPPLAAVVSRCLARELDDRPATMKALEYELTRAIEGRASAVAAVMGLQQFDGDDTTEGTGSIPQPLAHRPSTGKLAGLGHGSHGETDGESPSKLVTLHDQAAARSDGGRTPQAEPGTDKGKALLWVLLGAAVVIIAVLLLDPSLIPGLGRGEGGDDGGDNSGDDGEGRVEPPVLPKGGRKG